MIGPRRSLDSLAGRNEGDRNGEPSEGDWGCVLLIICAVAIVAIVAIALVGAALSSGPY